MLTALALAASLAAPDPAKVEEAERLRDEAIIAFEADDFEGAIEKFKQAYEVDPEPSYLFNIGRVYEELGQLKEALEYYQKFAVQPHLELSEREAAAERIKVLRNLVGEDEPDERSDPGVEPQPPPPRETDEPPDTPQRPYKPFVIAGATLLGLGGAAAIGGGVGFGVLARNRSDQVRAVADEGNPDGLTLTEVEDLDAQGRSFELLQITTASVGGAVAIVGAVLLAVGLSRRSKAKRATANVGAVWTRSTSGLVVSGRF